MEVTRAEAAILLDPPLTVRQVATLTAMARIMPSGRRREGRNGRPPDLYDYDAIAREHAAEAARTSKQFTDNDWIASALLARALIAADPAAGTLCWPDGSRAERLCPDFYGAVEIGHEKVMAHRVIWIAAEGEIPPGIQINHRNRLRWDNRRANLELVTWVENIRHARGQHYLDRSSAVAELASCAPDVRKVAAPAQGLMRAGGSFRKLVPGVDGN